ncbi:sigma-70 family RNA polymerase sigma factor [Henriciella sp.]|uniref:RNA polymerase sigma factor n=1 Tax=Henriciella sp. TaxID=1968823 RepID=UPI00261C1103|nr:sigma-70 family RNA polymerase sigma factor [Henriciella sp.]
MPKQDVEDLNDQLKRALSQCAEGDRNAFSHIYALTAPKFTSILINQLRDPEAARDVLQHAYLSIWRNAGRYDPSKGKAFTWMLVIIRNRGLDHLRSKARTPEMEEIGETIVDGADQPEDLARTGDGGRLVARHLALLPEHVARSIMMNIVEGMSCTEIGLKLDTSPNTVKGWIRRGLKRVRAEMPVTGVSSVL